MATHQAITAYVTPTFQDMMYGSWPRTYKDGDLMTQVDNDAYTNNSRRSTLVLVGSFVMGIAAGLLSMISQILLPKECFAPSCTTTIWGHYS